MDIPILINNFNRLTTTKKLVVDLLSREYDNIHIIDNDSTYEPLLSWYRDMRELITIHYLGKNTGHLALWSTGIINTFSDFKYLVYTDSDIELNPNTPNKFIEGLIDILEHFNIDKVGLAIEYKDIPDTKYCRLVKKIEGNYWNNKLNYKNFELYSAPIDTTFAVVKQKKPFSYGAVRVAGDFTCKHIPFYLNWGNLNEEETFIMESSNPTISTYKQHYLEWKKENQ